MAEALESEPLCELKGAAEEALRVGVLDGMSLEVFTQGECNSASQGPGFQL